MPHSDPKANEEAPDPSVARAERRLRLLAELAEIGMELARGLQLRAAAEPAGDAAQAKMRDPADAFGPLSRAIRLTLALEAKTDQELRDLKAGVVRALETEAAGADERRLKAHHARDTRLIECVMNVAWKECENGEEFENLCGALSERLDEDKAYYDTTGRPLRETVERLCKDLSLTPDWSRWDGEGWIDEDLPSRPRFSPFHTPSARKRVGDNGEILPPWCLHDRRAAAAAEVADPVPRSGSG